MKTIRRIVKFIKRNKEDLIWLAEGIGFVFSMAGIVVGMNILYLIYN